MRRGAGQGRADVLGVTADRLLEPVYGFYSLLAFKAKLHPEYRPLYMVRPDLAALVSITRAIGKAYLPHLTLSQGIRLVRKLRL